MIHLDVIAGVGLAQDLIGKLSQNLAKRSLTLSAWHLSYLRPPCASTKKARLGSGQFASSVRRGMQGSVGNRILIVAPV